MTLVEFAIYASVGRILIYIIRKFPLTFWVVRKWDYLNDLVNCDLCLGVWVYWGLALIVGANVINTHYVPIISELITGAVTSFLVWVFVDGMIDKFGTIYLE